MMGLCVGCSALGQIVILGSGCGLVQIRIMSLIHDSQSDQDFEGLKLSLRDPRYSDLLWYVCEIAAWRILQTRLSITDITVAVPTLR